MCLDQRTFSVKKIIKSMRCGTGGYCLLSSNSTGTEMPNELSADERKKIEDTALFQLTFDTTWSMSIQTVTVFVIGMFSSQFFSNEEKLIALTTVITSRIDDVENFRNFFTALFWILGVVAALIVVAYQCHIIENLDEAISNFPRRILEEFTKFFTTIFASMAGLAFSVSAFCYFNPAHIDHSKWAGFMYVGAALFVIGLLITFSIAILSQYRELKLRAGDKHLAQKFKDVCHKPKENQDRENVENKPSK